MKVIDILLALITGRFIGVVLGDFLEEWGIRIGFYENLIVWLFLPIFSLFCLWFAFKVGQKLFFIYQVAKHVLVGAFATVVDLKVFEFFVWFFSLAFAVNPLVSKSISFIVATAIKYLGNKYWTFQKYERENLRKEISQFVMIISIGLMIDVSVFHYLANVLGPQFSLNSAIWVKISVLTAAVIAAVWNFMGDKFLVFKK